MEDEDNDDVGSTAMAGSTWRFIMEPKNREEATAMEQIDENGVLFLGGAFLVSLENESSS